MRRQRQHGEWLLQDVGRVCEEYERRVFRNLPCRRIQCDEIGCRTVVISGRPKMTHVSTSHVERQNLTMRMKMRRFTRLTNAFSKKIENHIGAVAPHYMHYNFCRVHQTLRVTPAMEAGITHHVWDVAEIVALLESN